MKAIAQELADWIDIESITGNEGDYGTALGATLEREGFSIEYQEVEAGRRNLLGRAERPEVVFCTHLDTVPPFIPPRIERGTVWGRGACDAKGQALAMLLAAKRLVEEGERRVGFLFTVGEEIDSVGASFADAQLAADPSLRDEWSPRYTIVGEPTGNVFVSGHKGIFLFDLVGRGVAGHSSNPLGPSAIHELVGCCNKLTATDWGEDEGLGRGSINVGTIHGGHAPNVVAPEAKAELLIRAVEDTDVVRAKIEAALNPNVELVEGREQYGPVRFHVPDGEPSFPVAFGTDAPHLSRWGQPLLMGPGSIDLAHTKDERIEVAEIEAAVARYCSTVRGLLTSG